jgi:hypothetical protein
MPTATLIPRSSLLLSSSSSSSAAVVTLVTSSSVSSLHYEVDNSNSKDKDTSFSIVNSQSKQKICNSGGDEVSILRSKKIQGSREKTVAKKSQPGVKKRIRKKKQCSAEGCTNKVMKGGVCWTQQTWQRNDATSRVVTPMPGGKKESVSHTAPRLSDAATRDVPIKSLREVFASHMEQRWRRNDAASKDVKIEP